MHAVGISSVLQLEAENLIFVCLVFLWFVLEVFLHICLQSVTADAAIKIKCLTFPKRTKELGGIDAITTNVSKRLENLILKSFNRGTDQIIGKSRVLTYGRLVL